ncbi:peptide/nickel transport system permease protein [Streptosporangium subroseum]|uniref:Peptide/nickel transport system permease protein n=1 Tax=Streptosporangium subroseum TaxID=106412 RepID=A0A239EB22_9ACTN|nr:ABC transporter permease [Streptosporangium subroseum]SNS41885.1 peptide/nickel transport system permease protein [Streptosporangium subroseum]
MTSLQTRAATVEARGAPGRVPTARRPRRWRGWAGGAAALAVVALASTFITYGLGALGDANPAAAVLGETATPADIARMSHEFGLDRPFLEQYVTWLGHALTGDLGRSWFTQIPVAESIAERLPVDLSITGLAVLIAVLAGGAAGIGAAVSNGGRFDRIVTAVCALASTLPAFVAGIGLIVVFAVIVPVFPSGGYVPPGEDPVQWLRLITLPAVALSLDTAADLARQLRTGLVAALRENYVTGAVVRGLPARRVLLRHALRNAAGPAITVLGVHIPRLIGGAVVTEAVFALPGLGQLTGEAALKHDVPVVQGALLATIALVLVSNLVVNGVVARLRGAR